MALLWASLDRAERRRFRILKFFSLSADRCSGVIIWYSLGVGVLLGYQECSSPMDGECMIHDTQIWVSAERAMYRHRLSERPRAQIY